MWLHTPLNGQCEELGMWSGARRVTRPVWSADFGRWRLAPPEWGWRGWRWWGGGGQLALTEHWPYTGHSTKGEGSIVLFDKWGNWGSLMVKNFPRKFGRNWDSHSGLSASGARPPSTLPGQLQDRLSTEAGQGAPGHWCLSAPHPTWEKLRGEHLEVQDHLIL